MEKKIIPLKQRKKWTDEELDFTCIEIKKKEDNIDNFFYLDDNVLDNNCPNNCYLNKKVLIFGINRNDKQIGFSNGLIENCQSPNFAHTCNTFPGCSGGCIVNLANNCAIGIHKGECKNSDLNVGIFIKEISKYIKSNREIFSDKEILSDVSK